MKTIAAVIILAASLFSGCKTEPQPIVPVTPIVVPPTPTPAEQAAAELLSWSIL